MRPMCGYCIFEMVLWKCVDIAYLKWSYYNRKDVGIVQCSF